MDPHNPPPPDDAGTSGFRSHPNPGPSPFGEPPYGAAGPTDAPPTAADAGGSPPDAVDPLKELLEKLWLAVQSDPAILSAIIGKVSSMFGGGGASARARHGVPPQAMPHIHSVDPGAPKSSLSGLLSDLMMPVGISLLVGGIVGMFSQQKHSNPLLRHAVPIRLSYVPEMHGLLLSDDRGTFIGRISLSTPELADLGEKLRMHAVARRSADNGWTTVSVPNIHVGGPVPAAPPAHKVTPNDDPPPFATGPAARPR